MEIIPHHDETLMNMIPDKETALVCDNCYPECDDTIYYVTGSRAALEVDDYVKYLL